MAYSVTAYNVMIGSPSDVQERRLVERILAKWNHKHGEEKKLVFLPLKWEDDSYPDAAGRPPQKILNQQICERSDMLVAMFWTRLGSPTDEYDSGTIEEINVHINEGKQVFIYFCEKPIPDDVDKKQYEKLRAYRTELEMNQTAYYSTYTSDQDLEDKLMAHLDNMVAHKKLGTVEHLEVQKAEPKLTVAFDQRYELRAEYEKQNLMKDVLYSDEQCKQSLEEDGDIYHSLKQEEKDLIRLLHNDIPDYLNSYMRQKELDQFAEIFESGSDVKNYIDSWKMYLLADNAKEIELQIENDGPGIAKNVMVEIEAPDNHLMFIDKDTYRKLHSFQRKINPLSCARRRYAEEHNATQAFVKQMMRTTLNTRYIPVAGMDSSKYDFNAWLTVPSGDYFSYDKGMITARCKKITYEHCHVFSEPMYMIPISPGKGKIKVTYSCDEYDMCKHGTIDYEVVER